MKGKQNKNIKKIYLFGRKNWKKIVKMLVPYINKFNRVYY